MNAVDETKYGLESEAEQPEKLRKEIHDARELLTFAIAEGRTVEDRIIRDINEAENYLLASSPLTTESRIAFEKSYRDLARLLSPVTAEVARNQASREKRACLLGNWTCALLIIVVFHTLAFLTEGNQLFGQFFMSINYGLLGLLFFLLSFWARYLFTEVVTREVMGQITLFCYIFTIVFLLSPGLLLLLPPKSAALNSAMHESPIGIVFGCLKPQQRQDGNNEPGTELFCHKDGSNQQWLFNIGGRIIGWRPPTPPEFDGPHEAAVTNGNPQGDPSPSVQINGGVAVPLYLLVFALWGGAVNMLRRVPEYQWRGMDVKDSLTREQARESLIFQMTQVLAAPLIAITAYYVLEPSTQKASIALGFVSGFASHPILLAIRAVTDTLTPAKLATLPAEPPANSPGKP